MSSGTLDYFSKVSEVCTPRVTGGFVLDVDQMRNQVLREMVRVAGKSAGFAALAADLGPFVGYGV